ncbi:MAG: rRNA maturation RNase YbeY [Candidatus Cloacimonetes bacterium]|nr:rRNA maturation RNase YbeY [Candidatus Cloacimonadota bacterium]
MNIRKTKSILFNNNTQEKVRIDHFLRIFEIVIHGESLHPDSFVNLTLSEDGSIKKLNKKYLARDEITDVISFTADIPGVNFLGDIIIDTYVARQQKESRTLIEELQILFLHGLLHCLDYDHLSVEGKKLMCYKEDMYLKKFTGEDIKS